MNLEIASLNVTQTTFLIKNRLKGCLREAESLEMEHFDNLFD